MTRPPRGGPRRTTSSSETMNGTTNGPSHYGGGPTGAGRKNGGHGAPAPLLGMAPPSLSNHATHVAPHSHNHQTQANSSMGSQSSGSSTSLNTGRNGPMHYSYSSLPPHSVPHLHSDQYHRNYRGDSRYVVLRIF